VRRAGEAGAELQAVVECLAAEDLGVDRLLEFADAVEPWWLGPLGEPIEAAVATRDEPVGARREVDDDLSQRCSRALAGCFSASALVT